MTWTLATKLQLAIRSCWMSSGLRILRQIRPAPRVASGTYDPPDSTAQAGKSGFGSVRERGRKGEASGRSTLPQGLSTLAD